MIHTWELEKIRDWTVDQIRNRIWMAVDCGQSVPGSVSVDALRTELIHRGEAPIGYHNT